MILALDQATTTGWASGNPGDTPAWGVRNFAGASSGEVIGKFRHWLVARCGELKPTLIVFESPYLPGYQRRGGPPQNALTLRRLFALAGQVEAVAWELDVPCREARPSEIAKFFLGKSSPQKRAAKKAATIRMCALYGWNTVSNDAADALALWAMAEAAVSPAAAARRGEGPLFIPQTASAPKSARTRGAHKPFDEKELVIMAGTIDLGRRTLIRNENPHLAGLDAEIERLARPPLRAPQDWLHVSAPANRVALRALLAQRRRQVDAEK